MNNNLKIFIFIFVSIQVLFVIYFFGLESFKSNSRTYTFNKSHFNTPKQNSFPSPPKSAVTFTNKDIDKSQKCSLTYEGFPDPSVALGNFHKNNFIFKDDAELIPINSSNYYFMDNHLKYQRPTNKNVAFSSLFGTEKYVKDRSLQELLLGAIKTFRDPKKGNWKGSIIIITDHPKYVRKIFHDNKKFLNCNAKDYDDIPSEYMRSEDGDNSCKISVIYEPCDQDHPLKYKWIKSRMLHVLKKENILRMKEKLPILDYLFYRDVDIWSWADTQSLIDYLSQNYHGEDVAIWRQPGDGFERGGEILHGGIWMIHRELSFYWLRSWTMFMSMLSLNGATRDQISLGMTSFTHDWKYKATREERNKIRFGIDICIIPFGKLYPLDFTNREEWTHGVFLHWTGRKNYIEDQVAFKECGDEIEIDKAVLLDYTKDDKELDLPPPDPDEGLVVNLRDNNRDSIDIVYPTKKVTCKTKQIIQHLQKFFEPRRIFLIVPKLSDCGESIYFSPNIFCFLEDKVLPYDLMNSELNNKLEKYLKGIIPIHLSINKEWSNFITNSFLYIEDDFIPLQPGYSFGDFSDPRPPLISKKMDQSERLFMKKMIEKDGDYTLGKSAILVNRETVVDMMNLISSTIKQDGFQNFLKYIHNNDVPSNFFNILYFGFHSYISDEPDQNIIKEIKFDNYNSKEFQITKNLSGRCLNLQFLKEMQCKDVKALILKE